jgi:hypothetical protein
MSIVILTSFSERGRKEGHKIQAGRNTEKQQRAKKEENPNE